MDDEAVKDYEMQGINEDNDDPTDIEENYTLLEGKTIIIDDDSDENTDYIYQEALDKKESLDDIKEQLRDMYVNILDKGKISDTERSEIELLQDQYAEALNTIKNYNTISILEDNSIDYDELIKRLVAKSDCLYINEDGIVTLKTDWGNKSISWGDMDGR